MTGGLRYFKSTAGSDELKYTEQGGLQWNPCVALHAVKSTHVLLCNMMRMFFFSVETN